MICFRNVRMCKKLPCWNVSKCEMLLYEKFTILPVSCSASVLSSGAGVHFGNGQGELVVIGCHHDIARVLGQELARVCPLNLNNWGVAQNCAFDFLEIIEFSMNPVNHRLCRFRIIYKGYTIKPLLQLKMRTFNNGINNL